MMYNHIVTGDYIEALYPSNKPVFKKTQELLN